MRLNNNMAWPPRDPEVSRSLEEWGAWYSGDGGRLDEVYSRVRPSQRAGGLVGRAGRMLWGNPPPLGTRDRRIHLPLANDIASASSDMLFGQEPQIDWEPSSEVSSPRQKLLTDMLGEMGWPSLLSEAGEVAAALGGVYLRLGWDSEVAGHGLVSVVHADGALPTFRYGVLTEVTFWDVLESRGSEYLRHTETHSRGKITHQLWAGTRDNLGTLVPLTDHPTTADIVLDDEDSVATDIDRLTVSYIPNIRPVPQWRKLPGARSLGRSDYGVPGVTHLFDAIDETWTSWMRDIRHGKSRLLTASSTLESLGAGSGTYFDFDREVYEAIRMPLGENPTIDGVVSAQQFAIRVEEHSRTLKELTLAAVNSCGYSGSTFGLDTEVAKTATEVGAVRKRTTSSREKKIRYWAPALEGFLSAWAALTAVKFNFTAIGEDPKVYFAPDSTPTLLELAQVAQSLKAAQAASTETLVRTVHPDWDEESVRKEVSIISAETAPPPMLVADPFAPDTPPEEL